MITTFLYENKMIYFKKKPTCQIPVKYITGNSQGKITHTDPAGKSEVKREKGNKGKREKGKYDAHAVSIWKGNKQNKSI